MPDWTIDTRFDTPANADVLSFLRTNNPSAHSDVAEELLRSAEGVPGVSHYCPDSKSYAFVVLHLEDSTIIGLAYGQSALAFNLPGHLHAEACEQGGWTAAEVGPAGFDSNLGPMQRHSMNLDVGWRIGVVSRRAKPAKGAACNQHMHLVRAGASGGSFHRLVILRHVLT
jgi:hypothetical protein